MNHKFRSDFALLMFVMIAVVALIFTQTGKPVETDAAQFNASAIIGALCRHHPTDDICAHPGGPENR